MTTAAVQRVQRKPGQLRPGSVVAGVDGSPASRAALQWAATEAALAGAGLAICHVHGSMDLTGRMPPSPRVKDELLDQEVATASHHLDRTRISPIAGHGDTAAVLIQLSRGARMVVVGTHGYFGLAARVSPPIAARVIAGATCPVVVQPLLAGGSGPFAGHVVVGVDGSASSRRAVEFAFAHAASRDLPLVAVHVTGELAPDRWTDDTMLETCFVTEPAAETLLATEVEPVEARYPAVAVKRAVFSSRVQTGLIRAASGAALLVLGDRGRGRAARALLGSVAGELVSSAICPIAVVPSGAGQD